jgi:hypothetical protein
MLRISHAGMGSCCHSGVKRMSYSHIIAMMRPQSRRVLTRIGAKKAALAGEKTRGLRSLL